MSDHLHDHDDPVVRAAVFELAQSAPHPPELPTAPPLGRGRVRLGVGFGRGLVTAAAVFLLVLAAGATGWWLADQQTPASEEGVTDFAAIVDGIDVAFVTDDGVTLRGRLWQGDDLGIVVAPAFGGGATELMDVSRDLARSGHTVLVYDLRGQGASEGEEDVEALADDLAAAVEDLRTRGAERVYVLGFQHSATAAVQLAARDVPGLNGVAAMFAFEAYQGLVAAEAASQATTPVHYVGATRAGDTAPWALELANATPGSTVHVLPEADPEQSFIQAYGDAMVEDMLEFIAGVE
jgi:alpha/beta superfamily hydrolase